LLNIVIIGFEGLLPGFKNIFIIPLREVLTWRDMLHIREFTLESHTNRGILLTSKEKFT
jgi:hypothetical protein